MVFKYYSFIFTKAELGSSPPDGDGIDLSTGVRKTLLSYAKQGRPLVLNFGSYT